MSASEDDWFERIWKHREEVIYPSLFGANSDGIYTLSLGEVFDPRWSTCGAFRFAPTSDRKSWICVSSGLSNAWFDEAPDPSGPSGFGYEFLIETPEKSDWAIKRILQVMKYQIDLCCGKYPDAPPLGEHARIPLGSPIDFAESCLTHLVLTQPVGIPRGFQQDSGVADFYLMCGISEAERDFAKLSGEAALLDLLWSETDFPITDPLRRSAK